MLGVLWGYDIIEDTQSVNSLRVAKGFVHLWSFQNKIDLACSIFGEYLSLWGVNWV